MPSTLLTETFPGAPGGMNQALPAQDIDDTQAQFIQDGLVDFPALTRRRGPMRPVTGIAQPTRPATGIVTTLDPQGTPRYAVLNGDGTTGYFSAYSDDLTSLVDVATLPHALPTNPAGGSPYRVVDAKAGIKGGLFIGISSAYDIGAEQTLAYWLGGNRANYTTGTLTVARGSTAVTGAGTTWLGNVVPGMWLFANTDEGYTNTLIGYVLAVNNNGSITLASPSPYAITAKANTFQSLRGIYPRVTTGRVTTATTATDLNGGDTKFSKQGLGTGTWQVYRANDWAFIGKVASVQSDSHVTLTANASIAMADDAYYAIRVDGNWSLDLGADVSKPGWMNASYAQRQFFYSKADTHQDSYRLVYTDVSDPEAYDLSFAGTTDFVGSTSIVQESGRGMAAAYNALVLFKENETYALQGSEPSQFSISKIEDDGTLSTGSIQPYGGGIIWAGRLGIHFYDGVQVNNLTLDKLGQVWKNSIRTFDPTKYRMYSFVNRDHYVLYVEKLSPTVAPIKAGVSESQTSWVVVINMVTQAVTMATNLTIRGAIVLPAVSGSKVWYVVNGQKAGDTADHGFVADGDALFDEEGIDPIYGEYGARNGGSALGSSGAVGGPDFYFDSKKFDAGDSLRLKKFKLMAMHYLAQGGSLNIDVVLGLNDFGQTLASNFPASVFTWDTLRATFGTWNALSSKFSTWNSVIQSVFVPKRIKFQKQSQFMSFRVYQSTNTMARVKIGPFQLGYKIMRAGRV